MNTPQASSTSLFFPDLAQLAAGLWVSRAAGSFPGTPSLSDRDAGAVTMVAASQMDAVSPPQWPGPSRHGSPATDL